MNGILNRVENAVYNYLSGSVTTGSIYKGIGNEEKEYPFAVVYCESAREDFIGSGIWHVTTQIMSMDYAADTTEDQADTNADTLFNQLFLTTALNSINGSGSSVHVYDIIAQNQTKTIDGDTWVSTLTCDIIAVNN